MVEIDLFKTLITIFDKHIDTVNTLWGIFYAISLALLGFIYKSKEFWSNKTILLVLSLGFAVFAFGNSQAINRSQRVVEATSYQIINYKFTDKKLEKYLKPVANKYKTVSSCTLRIASLGFSLLVVLGIWAPYISIKINKNNAKANEI